jgi:hypothetical protein
VGAEGDGGATLNCRMAGVVTEPAAVQQVLDDVDLRLLRWLSNAVLTATRYLLNLGEGSARLLLDGVGVAVPMTNPTKS